MSAKLRVLIATAALLVPAASTNAAPSRFAQPTKQDATVATAKGKMPLRARLGGKLIRFGERLRGPVPPAPAKPAAPRSQAERLLGAHPDRAVTLIRPETHRAVAAASARLRETHESLRRRERAIKMQRSPMEDFFEIRNVQALYKGPELVGYKLDMVNHNGAYEVAQTVLVKPNSVIAGAPYGAPGKLLGEGGVFAPHTRQGYASQAIHQLGGD